VIAEDQLEVKARQAAASSLALLAAGDEEASKEAMRFYLADAMASFAPIVAIQALLAQMMAVAVVASNHDPVPFQRVAAHLVVRDGEW
jgi:hypothetical protein